MELDELNDHDEDESEETQAYRALRRIRERGELFRRADAFHSKILEEQKFWEAIRFDTGEFSTKIVTTDDVRCKQEITIARQNYISILKNNPHAIVNLATYAHVPIKDIVGSRRDYRSQRFLTKMSKWPPMSIFACWLLKSTAFEIVMISVIVMNSLLVAADQELDENSKTGGLQETFEGLDFFFLFMFVAEIMLKWLDNFTTFWAEGWNIFDFLITTVSLVAPFLDVVYPETGEEDQLEDILALVRYLRIVRILRSLNVVTRIHKIELIWTAVLKTFSSLIFITGLMFIFFFIFAIMGMQIFDRYSLSHKKKLLYRKSFQTLEDAFVTIFQLFTLDHWYELLIEMAQIMGWATPTSFILLWVLIGSFIFRNIFVGVMVNNFQVIREELIRESESLQKARHLAKRINIFAIDHIEQEVSKQIKNPDPLMDWESGVFHTLEVVKAISKVQSPTMWPRDTLYAHYVLLEALASNTDEKHELIRLLENELGKLSDG